MPKNILGFIWDKLCVCTVSHSVLSDSETPRTSACQAPLSMGFSRHEYWSRLPFPGDLSGKLWSFFLSFNFSDCLLPNSPTSLLFKVLLLKLFCATGSVLHAVHIKINKICFLVNTGMEASKSVG